MRNALENFTAFVRLITNLRSADDVVLLAGRMEELQELVSRFNKASFQFCLSLNASNTEVMKICRQPNDEEELRFITVNNKRIGKCPRI